jgi:hypothetical protein
MPGHSNEHAGSSARGEAERGDGGVGLHGGEGDGGRDPVGDGERAFAGGESVVEEPERVALRVGRRRRQGVFGVPTQQQEGAAGSGSVELYWLPLGAGGHSVRYNGGAFEWIVARLQHRRRCDLYHSALQVYVDGERWVVEQAPVPPRAAASRGVVVQ